MKVDQMLEILKGVENQTGILLNTTIEVGQYDMYAAHLLEALYLGLDDTATQKDVDGIIDAMKWWSTFFHAMVPTDKSEAKE